MVKLSKVVLLKAVAMSALLTNVGEGTEVEERTEWRHFTAGGAMATLPANASFLNRLLDDFEKVRQTRIDILRQPRVFDMKTVSLAVVFKHLLRAKENDTKAKISLVNIKQEEFNTILNDKNAEAIDENELVWSYQPQPISVGEDPDEEDARKYTVQDWFTNAESVGQLVPYYFEDEVGTTTGNDVKLLGGGTPDKKIPSYIDDKDEEDTSPKKDTGLKDIKKVHEDEESMPRLIIDVPSRSRFEVEDGPLRLLKGEDRRLRLVDEEDGKIKLVDHEDDGVRLVKVEKDAKIKKIKGIIQLLYPKAVDVPKNAAARGLWAPTFEALSGNLGGKGTPLILTSRVSTSIDPVVPDKPMIINWKGFTPKNDISKPDQPAMIVNYGSTTRTPAGNLIRMFCQGSNPIAVKS